MSTLWAVLGLDVTYKTIATRDSWCPKIWKHVADHVGISTEATDQNSWFVQIRRDDTWLKHMRPPINSNFIQHASNEYERWSTNILFLSSFMQFMHIMVLRRTLPLHCVLWRLWRNKNRNQLFRRCPIETDRYLSCMDRRAWKSIPSPIWPLRMVIAGTRSLCCGVARQRNSIDLFDSFISIFNRSYSHTSYWSYSIHHTSSTIHLTYYQMNDNQNNYVRPGWVYILLQKYHAVREHWFRSLMLCLTWFYFLLATCFNVFLWTQTWSYSRTTSRVLAPSGGQSSLTFGLRPIPKATPEVAAVVVVVADETPVVKVNEPTTLVNADVIPTIVSGKWTSGIFILSLWRCSHYTIHHWTIFVAYLRQKHQPTRNHRWLQIKTFRTMQQHQLLRQAQHPKRYLPRLCYRLSNKN